jgi:hypothetical protein
MVMQSYKYAAGVQPYFEVLKRITLPPRGRKGSRVNRTRVHIVCAALHQAKIGHRKNCPLEQAGVRCALCRYKVPYKRRGA